MPHELSVPWVLFHFSHCPALGLFEGSQLKINAATTIISWLTKNATSGNAGFLIGEWSCPKSP